MFTNTGYEAFYSYLGLQIHSEIVRAITSEGFFKGLSLIIFGSVLFITTIRFFTRYMPSTLVARRQVPLSAFAKIIFCLFIGLSLLKIGGTTDVLNYQGESWSDNPYVQARLGNSLGPVKVSYFFHLAITAAEETAALLSKLVDKIMAKEHSQLSAPNYFYKAIMYSSIATIKDPTLKDSIQFYTENCLGKILPEAQKIIENRRFDFFGNASIKIDQKLAEIAIGSAEAKLSCLDVKNEVRGGLLREAKDLAMKYKRYGGPTPPIVLDATLNMHTSNLLVNHYLSEKESFLGVMKGSQLPTTTGKIVQYLNKLFSFDSVLAIVTGTASRGTSEAINRSHKFSEHLARSPHISGLIKLAMVVIFPFLVFFVIAGYWRVMVYWLIIYFSISLWAPLNILLYHIMLNVTLSAELLSEIGVLSDGVSLYASRLITSRIYYFYSIYSWGQLLVATITTGSVFMFIRPLLAENQPNSAPEFVSGASNAAVSASTALRAGGGLL